MALSDDEIGRIKALLFDHVLSTGADVYIGYKPIYSVVRDYVSESSVAAKTCSTAVTAAGPASLTLGDVTDLAVNVRVQIDLDSARESALVRAVSGLTISVVCTKTHSGSYPVQVESGITIVRGLVSDLIALSEGRLQDLASTAHIKRVDEVEFAENQMQAVESVAESLRLRLAAACGLSAVYQANRQRGSAPSRFEVY